MKNNSSNVVINNNSINSLGGIIMKNTNINSINTFAEAVKKEVATRLGEAYKVSVKDIVKNNNTVLKGLIIHASKVNIAPTIYLESYYSSYEKGDSMGSIIDSIIRVYEEYKVSESFDIDSVTNFDRCRDRICLKLINADKNKELLADAPHRILAGDLAIVYFVLVAEEEDGTSSVTLKNNIFNTWDIDEEGLYNIALANTQQLFRGKVESLEHVIMEIMSEHMDKEFSREFYDLCIEDDGMMPIYVCTNLRKYHGASVILYDDILKEFAHKMESDIIIIPSSIHETLLIPATEEADIRYLRELVSSINEAEVPSEEVLSDNVYLYSVKEDKIQIA